MMKKTLLCIPLMCALLTGISAHAQTEKGNLLISNDVTHLNFRNRKDDKAFSIGMSSKVGYFVANNLAVGGYSDFYYNNHNASVNEGDRYARFREISLGSGVFSRYYFKKIRKPKQRSCFFAEASTGFENTFTNKQIFGSLNAALGVGWNYFITDNISLSAMVKYKVDYYNNYLDNPRTLNFSIGAQFYLPGKKNKVSKPTH